jgi:glycosyltransferase involved in cell wall biosynthesis
MRILFIGAINNSKPPKGGEEYKNQLILEKLVQRSTLKTIAIDTYNWKRKPLLMAKLFLKILFIHFDSIVISASSASTFLLLKLVLKFKPSVLNKTHYLVIGGYFPEGIKTKRYDWKIYQNLKSVVLEGEILKEQILSCSDLKNIKVVPNFKKFNNNHILSMSTKDKFNFVYIGRISKPKGVYEIIEAVRVLKMQSPELIFSVDFYGPKEEEIEFPVDLPMFYKGYLDIMNKPEVSYATLTEYACMLFPTFWQGEGFPGVIIDAYVAGLPVIATDWNMNKEVVVVGETGLIIPIQDANALAMAMLKMIQNPEAVRIMSMNSMKKAKDFHIDTVWPAVEKVIYN